MSEHNPHFTHQKNELLYNLLKIHMLYIAEPRFEFSPIWKDKTLRQCAVQLHGILHIEP